MCSLRLFRNNSSFKNFSKSFGHFVCGILGIYLKGIKSLFASALLPLSVKYGYRFTSCRLFLKQRKCIHRALSNWYLPAFNIFEQEPMKCQINDQRESENEHILTTCKCSSTSQYEQKHLAKAYSLKLLHIK